MKLRCWVCAVLGLLLLQVYVRGEDAKKPALPVMKKGVVVKVTDNEVVIKSKDDKQGEVSYPVKEISQHIQLSEDVLEKVMAELRTRSKYVTAPKYTLADLKPGTEVSVDHGFSHLNAAGKVVEDGEFYQIRVTKLAKTE